KISITLNNNTATVNGKKISLSAPAKVINGATMVPLRFVSESLGSKVYWYNEISTVVIVSTKQSTPVITLKPGDYSISYESKQDMKELSEAVGAPAIYGYYLDFEEYIKNNYPKAVYLRNVDYS